MVQTARTDASGKISVNLPLGMYFEIIFNTNTEIMK